MGPALLDLLNLLQLQSAEGAEGARFATPAKPLGQVNPGHSQFEISASIKLHVA